MRLTDAPGRLTECYNTSDDILQTAAMTEESNTFSIDWRVAFGFTITVIWITTGLVYLLAIVGWDNFVHLPTADIGSFLEGAFAPYHDD